MTDVRPGSAAAPDRLWAKETGLGRYQVEVRAGGLRLLSDQPSMAGGLGTGPTPHQLVSAGLASCTIMTLRMYADRKSWPVSSIAVAVDHARGASAARDSFDITILLPASLSEDQRARLLAIADRCPVHLMLERGADIRTRASLVPDVDEEAEGALSGRNLQDVPVETGGRLGGA